jgi:UDP-N-acetylmuramate dehydrogenase
MRRIDPRSATVSARVTGIVSEPGYTVIENAPLAGRNTFHVTARADMLIDVHATEALPTIAAYASLQKSPPLILGGGSNILFTRDWPGAMLSMSTSGIRILENDSDAVLVRFEAGENWNDAVQWSLGQGFCGLENLILIPGTVGAAPIQNIGAYGVEIREFMHAVEAFEWRTRAFVRLSNADCRFDYRDSVFKRDPSRYIVTGVELRLPREHALRVDYAGIREELAALQASEPTPVLVAEAVARLRTRKLPNPALIGNAGSFFKNPIVDARAAESLSLANPTLPMWSAPDGRKKLSAAWLIDACGLKGSREGDAGVSEQHALVLVNHGNASGAQIWSLAQRVIETVQTRFGVKLEPEPIVI